jgi:hypothetical protein
MLGEYGRMMAFNQHLIDVIRIQYERTIILIDGCEGYNAIK